MGTPSTHCAGGAGDKDRRWMQCCGGEATSACRYAGLRRAPLANRKVEETLAGMSHAIHLAHFCLADLRLLPDS